ncbi:hypothetical protein SELMODRAFT_424884 [Selaginella moellendorffii]|uniref:Uncharacterized protein n=1 Tax=Selaginella moellendorffii TaxID=88036 RepID=D8SRB4_SELML|nr:hypothetical protein SELMODRAFT_424884 [Selaginella moellendorffii]
MEFSFHKRRYFQSLELSTLESDPRARQIDTGELIRFPLEIGLYGVCKPYSMESKQPAHCRGRARNARGVAAPKGTVIDPKTNRNLYDRSTRLATVLWAILSEASAWFVMVKTNYTA